MDNTRIHIAQAMFNVADEYDWLSQCEEDGAVVTFIGKVRNHNFGDNIVKLTLEHYPGMAEKVMADIIAQARDRWPLHKVSLIHRVGSLFPSDKIVFVGVISVHRSSAFAAAEFIMDYLKTCVPIWKHEKTSQGERWLYSRHSDKNAANRW